jgi:Flp pilus assembly protein TadB
MENRKDDSIVRSAQASLVGIWRTLPLWGKVLTAITMSAAALYVFKVVLVLFLAVALYAISSLVWALPIVIVAVGLWVIWRHNQQKT